MTRILTIYLRIVDPFNIILQMKTFNAIIAIQILNQTLFYSLNSSQPMSMRFIVKDWNVWNCYSEWCVWLYNSLFHNTRICIEYTHNPTHIYTQNKLYRQGDYLWNEKEQMSFDGGWTNVRICFKLYFSFSWSTKWLISRLWLLKLTERSVFGYVVSLISYKRYKN